MVKGKRVRLMKKRNMAALLCCLTVTGPVFAALDEWTFENDAAGLTLSEAANSGSNLAVFAAGGTGFVETDGAGHLLCTHAGSGPDGMWSGDTVLDAAVTNGLSGVYYLRYDFHYDLSGARHTNGCVLGLSVTDSSGTKVAGLAFTRQVIDSPEEPPVQYHATPLAEDMSDQGQISVIAKVDMNAHTMAVWYDLTGGNRFNENLPATSNIPVTLTSIDKLRFQATGDFRPAGSTDYAAVDTLRTASTWAEIAGNVPLSDPEVDDYNLRIGTQAFQALYHFTTNTLLVETAEAIQGMGSDVIKFYLGVKFTNKYNVTMSSAITNLALLARDEPSCRRVFDMPFKYYIAMTYTFVSQNEVHWRDNGMTTEERDAEYAEIYGMTRHFLTTYNDTGKRLYIGHWEGDWHLLPGPSYNTATNPPGTWITNMVKWLNVRQQAVDDARRDTPHTNVYVFHYSEVNRVRDAMLNAETNNQRLVNAVLPFVTNLDYVSWSSYDGQDLAPAALYETLDYIESKLSTNKASVIPGRRVFIGEYGWGYAPTLEQEPVSRAYVRSLMAWGTPFMLFWQMYNNEAGRIFWLIDDAGQKTPCYYMHQRFYNAARLQLGEFRQNYARLPDDTEFSNLAIPLLAAPLPEPVSLTLTNLPATNVLADAATIKAVLRQGVYGEPAAHVFACYGTVDGGTNRADWQQVVDLGLNSRFGAADFSAQLAGLQDSQTYYYRFYATNTAAEVWAPASFTFTTLQPPSISKLQFGSNGCTLWVDPGGSSAPESLLTIQATTNLLFADSWTTVYQTNVAGFSYWLDPESLLWTQRFYRAVLTP